MKILLINYEYPPIGGGAGNATYFLARALVRLGHEPWVLTSAFAGLPDHETGDGVRVVRIPAGRRRADRGGFRHMALFGLRGRHAALRLAKAESFDGTIAFFTIPCAHIGLALKKSLGIPFVISLRGGDVPALVRELRWLHWLLTPFRRHLLKSAAAVVANDEGLARLSRLADPFPVQVVPNGVDPEYFKPSEPRRPGPPFRFLFVGRFHPQKQLPFLFRETATLARRTGGAFQLVMVGDGPEQESLHRLAAKLGIAAQVEWHGWLAKDRLREIYQSADCFLNPSAYEGMPNCVLEAMACGLPVVASAIPGHITLARSGETALLIDAHQPGTLAEAMHLVRSDAGLQRRLGEAARRMVAAEYTWTRVAQSYLELLVLPNPASDRN